MLPEHTNSLYQKEARSSIALAKDVADKINELVDAINEAYDVNLEKTQEQDGKIRGAVLYMKDNLLNSLNDLMEVLRDSGFIDDRIEYHCGILKQRLDNLLGSVTKGSTTMDAEIIDARTGALGESYMNLGNAIRGQFKNTAYTIRGLITDDNYSDKLPDANLIDEPCSYQLNFTYNATDITANLPYTEFKSTIDELITFKDHYYRQLLIGNNYIYTRHGVKTTAGIEYNPWYAIYDKTKSDEVQKKSYKTKGVIDAFGYAVNLPDANKILESCTYQLNFSYGSTDIPANLPYKTFTSRIDELITFADKYYRQLLISDKYIYTRNGVLSASKDTVDYGEWVLIWSQQTSKDLVFTVDKNGGADYTSLTKCVFDNAGNKCTIYVKPGDYDLITEFKHYFGSDFFTKSTLEHHGLPVQNGTKFIMDSGAEVTFLYDGSNSVVEEYFSPFIMKGSGGEIHGGKITCKNCRYAIHDDVYPESNNSKSVIDSVYITYNSARNVGIGGGFGKSSDITVTGCVIINERTDSLGYGIYYHNNSESDSISYLKIDGNYVSDNIVVQPFGTTTKISTAVISGNHCNAIVKIPNAVDNIKMYSFNNYAGGVSVG